MLSTFFIALRIIGHNELSMREKARNYIKSFSLKVFSDDLSPLNKHVCMKLPEMNKREKLEASISLTSFSSLLQVVCRIFWTKGNKNSQFRLYAVCYLKPEEENFLLLRRYPV